MTSGKTEEEKQSAEYNRKQESAADKTVCRGLLLFLVLQLNQSRALRLFRPVIHIGPKLQRLGELLQMLLRNALQRPENIVKQQGLHITAVFGVDSPPLVRHADDDVLPVALLLVFLQQALVAHLLHVFGEGAGTHAQPLRNLRHMGPILLILQNVFQRLDLLRREQRLRTVIPFFLIGGTIGVAKLDHLLYQPPVFAKPFQLHCSSS